MSMKEVAVYFDVLRQRRDISQPTASPAIVWAAITTNRDYLRDTPQPLKRRGFLGQPAHWRAYAPTGLSSPVQDVDCGVVVSIKRKATAAINPAIR